MSEEDDAEYGIPLETRVPLGAFSDGDAAETRNGRVSDPEIRASAIRPALVVLAVAAAPFGVGLALGYPRASAATLPCLETTPNERASASAACVTDARAARLERALLAAAAAGALFAGRFADSVGRRSALRLAAAVSAAGWVAGELVFGVATGGEALGRCLVGAGAGAATTASVLLAFETAAPASRALAVAALQLALALGLALSHLLAYIASVRNPGARPHGRRLALFAAAVNAWLAAGAGGTRAGSTRRRFPCSAAPAVPESPGWLARRGREPSDVARAVAFARGLSEADPRVAEEAARIFRDAAPRVRSKRGGVEKEAFSASHLLTRGNLSRALFKTTGLVAVATLGGLSLPSRTASIALVSGFEDAPAAAWAFSAAKALGSLLCVFAMREGGLGRRVAFLLSVCGMLAANVAVVASLVLAPPPSSSSTPLERSADATNARASSGDAVRALAPLLFAFAHAAGAATVPWLAAAEAFAFPARGAALGFAAAAHWSFLLDAQRGFAAVAGAHAAAGGVAAFGAFGVVCAAGLSLVAPRGQTLVPEADGAALERAAPRALGSAGSADGKRTIGIARGF